MVEGISIRTCLPGEAERLLELWAEATAEPTATDDLAGLGVLFAAHDDAVLLALASDRIVGSVIASFDGWRGNIYRLAVHPGHRRRGIGRLLVVEAERLLAWKGARRLTAVVDSHSALAVPFWRSLADLGWRPTHGDVRFAKTIEAHH